MTREKLFSDLEGLRIAMEIEDRGRNFYQKAYENAQKPEHKDLFLLLKHEEVAHYETFKRMYEQLKTEDASNDMEYLFDQESSRYLTVLAEGHVFPDNESAAAAVAKLNTLEEVLKLALQAEKDSILFYDELARQSKFEKAKQVFLRLKEEEQTHVVKLREMIKA